MSTRLVVTNTENAFCVPGPGHQPSALYCRHPLSSLVRKELAAILIKETDLPKHGSPGFKPRIAPLSVLSIKTCYSSSPFSVPRIKKKSGYCGHAAFHKLQAMFLGL